MGKLLSTLKRGAYFPCPQHLTHVVADITRELVDADSSIDFDSKYVVDDERGTIGRGKFGMVLACCLRPDKGFPGRQLFALKVRSVGAALTIRHTAVKLVFDLCDGGDLYERVGNYSNREAKILLRNLTDGLAFIHSKGLMHRDLKPENILMVSRSSNTEIKIADFGLARGSAGFPLRLPRSRTICGSDFYLAPEIIRQEEYGREVDIWSLGVIAYVVLTGSLPFYNAQLHKLYRQILVKDINLDIIGENFQLLLTAGSRDFICRLLQLRPEDRPAAETALQHPWLSYTSPKSKSYRPPPTANGLLLTSAA
ncbi:hypothetical protein, conserved [Perkinsus marinus ATCC 50983]|uniref:Protein kinase domain-containing protein n=1 Tax=Perkinsus marinus (strain ATCC 50983 / TXsc) TaxID=423536 RepID=C5K771_PERM5|nr:hypothetical protein, conserved [Perkinsus marinus ATCC 50983]EER19406.1 hypothetical protein, conserved [Perkinsus marinus ATCC 50983]|eukprot:XP_002787610.1 hypothetical protein, conserved [Perkinsus marinus ATCC 50983]